MKQSDLQRQIREVIDSRLARRETVQMSWIVKQVLHDHGVSMLDDFVGYCSQTTVWNETRDVLRRMKGAEAKEEGDDQPVLPGFFRLQKRYVFERDGEQVVVPLERMSDAEVEAKADELRSMATGCLNHARELYHYLKLRQAAETPKAG